MARMPWLVEVVWAGREEARQLSDGLMSVRRRAHCEAQRAAAVFVAFGALSGERNKPVDFAARVFDLAEFDLHMRCCRHFD